MKRIFSLFVLALLVISAVPAVFAQGAVKDRVMQQEPVAAGSPAVEPAKRSVDSPAPGTLVERARERLEEARNRYDIARERYMTAVANQHQRRAAFEDARETLRACRDSASDACVDARKQVRLHAREFLDNSAELVISELERVKSKIESSEDLSESEIADIVSGIDARIYRLHAAKESVDGLSEESAAADINEAARNIRNAWVDTKPQISKAAGRLALARLNNIVVQVDKLSARFERTKLQLESRGLDVSGLEAILDDFNAELDLAKAKYEESRQLWAGAEDPKSIESAAKESAVLMREAQDALVRARELLRDAMQEIRTLGQGQLAVEPASEE